VLLGGDSNERDVSLKSGANVAKALQLAGHEVEMLDPSEQDLAKAQWQRFDVCFIAMHGGAGEDGRIQRFLKDRNVAFTCSGQVASQLAMSKSATKMVLRDAGINSPDYVLLSPHWTQSQYEARTARLGFPVVVKPDSEGSSLGIRTASSIEELIECAAESRRFGSVVIAEKYVSGREFTIAVFGREPLPLLEIDSGKGIFDYQSKYSGKKLEHNFETGLSPITVNRLQETALAATVALDTTGLCRVDLMLDNNGQVWVLEVNTVPGLTEMSLATKASERVGITLSELCDWMVRDALRRTTNANRDTCRT